MKLVSILILSHVQLLFASISDVQKLCRSTTSTKSCGQCIRQHPDCAWCLDTNMQGPYRCDSLSSLEKNCTQNLIYFPKTEQKIAPQHNVPLGSKYSDGETVIRLEPQQIVLRMKPGAIHEVKFSYLQSEDPKISDFIIQTSEYKSIGIGIDFGIFCHGVFVSGKQCTGVKPSEIIQFVAKISLNECKAKGDIAISIGVYGYHTVSALYITPICGCECEKVQNQERRSFQCHGVGDLICGVCECLPEKGGNNCECDLQNFNVESAMELENKCRKEENEPVCSGNGICRCGRCQCNEQHITGEFCDCRGMDCIVVDGKLCAGQGECTCGKCRCEEGFTGEDCSCTLDQSSCIENEELCNGHGKCECGKCICQKGYTGRTCGVSTEEEHIDSAEEFDDHEILDDEDMPGSTTTIEIPPENDYNEDDEMIEPLLPANEEPGESTSQSVEASDNGDIKQENAVSIQTLPLSLLVFIIIRLFLFKQF